MTAADREEVRRIYLEGIATGNATFEAEEQEGRPLNRAGTSPIHPERLSVAPS